MPISGLRPRAGQVDDPRIPAPRLAPCPDSVSGRAPGQASGCPRSQGYAPERAPSTRNPRKLAPRLASHPMMSRDVVSIGVETTSREFAPERASIDQVQSTESQGLRPLSWRCGSPEIGSQDPRPRAGAAVLTGSQDLLAPELTSVGVPKYRLISGFSPPSWRCGRVSGETESGRTPVSGFSPPSGRNHVNLPQDYRPRVGQKVKVSGFRPPERGTPNWCLRVSCPRAGMTPEDVRSQDSRPRAGVMGRMPRGLRILRP